MRHLKQTHTSFACLFGIAISAASCLAQSYKITTVAGANGALPGNSSGLVADASGNVYFPDGDVIQKLTPGGTLSVYAGDPKGNGGGYYGDGGPAVGAGLNSPASLALDSAGNLYITDFGNSRIRKVSTNGTITTVAGGGTNPTLGGQATQTFLSLTSGLAVDSAGNIFITENFGSGAGSQVVKVAPDGTITAYAGDPNTVFGFSSLGDGGPATKALIGPTGLAVDSAGNIYLADAGNNRIRKISTAGIIATVAGSNTTNFTGDGGLATSAGLNRPMSVAVDAAGSVYIADAGDYRIRKVTPDGNINTIAGTGKPDNSGDGGPATSAAVNMLNAIALGNQGQLYLTDVRASDGAGLIRVLTPVVSPPSITSGAVVPLDGTSNTIQPGEWSSIFGTNLATAAVSWTGNFPTSLGGTTVTVDQKPAYLSYVSPSQINFQMPDDTHTGSVSVVVTAAGGTATSTVTLAPFAPSFSLLDATHVAGIILRSDGSGAYGGGSYDIVGPTGTSLGYKTVAAKAGDVVELFGVGFGPTSSPVPAGAPYSGAAPTTSPVPLLMNGTSVTPLFSGLTAAGLYQFNVQIPAGLGTGDVSLQATAGGVHTQSSVVISLQ
jgi:uncharacterized protein (TIGR03437 family)